MRAKDQRKHMQQQLHGKPLTDLLIAYDIIQRDPAGANRPADRYTDRLVLDTAERRTRDHALALDSAQACNELENLMHTYLTEGAHANPSWQLHTTALVRVLSERHPEAQQAMTEWEDGHWPEHDTPTGPLIHATRQAIHHPN